MRLEEQQVFWDILDARDKTLLVMRIELVEKEAIVQQLIAALAESQAALAESQAALAESQAEQTVENNAQLWEKAEQVRIIMEHSNQLVGMQKLKEIINTLEGYKQKIPEERISTELLLKKEVIFEQATALRACRRSLPLFSTILDRAFMSKHYAKMMPAELLLEAKDAEKAEWIIQKQHKALYAHHALGRLLRSVRLFFLMQPLSIIKKVGSPRIGILCQHEPRAMVLSNTYHHKAILLSAYPRISIVTPSFKQASYIERTLKSVFGQQYPNLEYFVQDGYSQDGTVDILRQYEHQLSGYESKTDSGQSQAINLGFAKTSGEIMAWLNSDDLLLPGALACVADYFIKHPEVDVLYGNRLLIDENDMEIGRWILPGHDNEILSWADYVPQETLFWRRSIWDKVGGQIDESFRFAMDWDLLVRFRGAGAKFAHIPRFLGAFRIHEHQKTSAAINDIGHQEMDRIRERLLGRVPSRKEIRKAITPFLLKHVVIDMGYRIKTRLGGK